MAINSELLAILACPACRSGLESAGEGCGLICRKCAVVYPIVEDIPILLVEEAVSLRQWNAGEDEERGRTMPEKSA